MRLSSVWRGHMKKYFFLFLNWVFGLLFAIFSMAYLFAWKLFPVTILALGAVLLLPPAREFLYSKTGKAISFKVRKALIISILVTFTIYAVHDLTETSKRNEENLQAYIAQQKIERFKSERTKIIGSIKNAIRSGDYEFAISESTIYLHSNDTELNALNKTAAASLADKKERERQVQIALQEKQRLEEVAKHAQEAKIHTPQILAKLRKVPASDIATNIELYRELVRWNPDNLEYHKKLNHYLQKHELAMNRGENVRKQFLGPNGPHMRLQHVIRSSMHNPASYKHVKTVYEDKGSYLLVQTTFRGTNGFGAIMTNRVTAKVSPDTGHVLQIIEQ